MALTINYTTSSWPPTVGSGNADTCIQSVLDYYIARINSNITLGQQFHGDGAGSAGGTNANIMTGTKDYATLVSILANAVNTDAYANNIKSSAWTAMLPGYPSAVNADNPLSGRTDLKMTRAWQAILTGVNWNGDGGLAGFDFIQFAASPPQGWFASGDPTSTPFGTRLNMWRTGFHEQSHLWGRVSGVCQSSVIFDAVDLLMYSAANTRSLIESGTRYISVDAGTTNIGDCNPTSCASGDDFEGFISSVANDPFTKSGNFDTAYPPKWRDWQVLSMIGLPLTKTALYDAGLPQFSANPTITGTPAIGQTLTAHNGTAASTDPTAHATVSLSGFSWYRNSITQIATGSTYQVQSADQGTAITIRQTGSNWIGDEVAISADTNIPAGAGFGGGAALRFRR